MSHIRNTVLLLVFVGISLSFFHLAIDNGFWNGYDYVILENSLMMDNDPSAAFASSQPFKFQPMIYAIHFLLFTLFKFNASGYMIFNILLHGLNSFLVFVLVDTLLRDRAVAALSGLLFVFTIGSYGKSVMATSGLEDLVITMLTLLTMIMYFRNELYGRGKTLSLRFILALLFFLASMLTRSTSFAILGCFLAFNFFFRKERESRVFNANFSILLVMAVLALIVKLAVFRYAPPLYTRYPGLLSFVYLAFKNVINYLVRMIFPIHTSYLVTQAGPVVRFIYRFATEIRILIALTVVSYSFFGFVFGNRTIRFFIAWTYIMVLPFAFFQFPKDWLNMRHLYLVSVGFVSVIAAGAVYCSRLISRNRWRRFVPFIVPLAFILMSRFIIVQLDSSYERRADDVKMAEFRRALADKFPSVRMEGDRLVIPK